MTDRLTDAELSEIEQLYVTNNVPDPNVCRLISDLKAAREALAMCRGPLFHGYRGVSSVTADKVRNVIVPMLDAALPPRKDHPNV